MSYFKAKMHQNRFWLGLCPIPHWGAYSAPPDPLVGFKRPYIYGKGDIGREGKEEREGKGKMEAKAGVGEEEERMAREGMEGRGPLFLRIT